jgi:hypothetical protein
MDQGWATVVATFVALIGGTLLGGWLEARRTDARIRADREWLFAQQKEEWSRVDEIATRKRLRKLQLERLRETRDVLLAVTTGEKPPQGSLVGGLRNLNFAVFDDDDLEQQIYNWLSQKPAPQPDTGLARRVMLAALKKETEIVARW